MSGIAACAACRSRNSRVRTVSSSRGVVASAPCNLRSRGSSVRRVSAASSKEHPHAASSGIPTVSILRICESFAGSLQLRFRRVNSVSTASWYEHWPAMSDATPFLINSFVCDLVAGLFATERLTALSSIRAVSIASLSEHFRANSGRTPSSSSVLMPDSFGDSFFGGPWIAILTG